MAIKFKKERKRIMRISGKIHLVLALFTLCLCISCAGGMKKTSSPVSEVTGDRADLESNQPLAVWESQPRVVGQGSGLQLLLKASEGMSFIYAASKEKGGQDLLYLSSHNMADTFSKSYAINQVPGEVSAHGENNPLLKPGVGIGMYALWGGSGNLKFARSMNFGRSFSEPIVVNDEVGHAYHSFQTMEVAPDGTIYVAWLDGRDKKTNPPGTGSLYISKSVDGGATFGKNIKVSGAICPCCRPALAFDETGRVYISWRHVYEGHNRIIVVATSEDKGETWSEKIKVTEQGWKINGCAHSGPSMAYANGNLFVVWYTGADNKASLQAAISSDSGKSFRNLGEIQGNVLDANHPAIGMNGNEAWIIFQGRDPNLKDGWGTTRPWLTKITSSGETYSPQVIPFTGESVAYPQLFLGTGSRIYATWTELTSNGHKAVLCRGRLQNN